MRPSHQVCHTKPLLKHPWAHITGAPDTRLRTYPGSHKRATTNHLTFTHRHSHHTRNPQQQAQQPSTKTAPAKRTKDNIHTQPRNIHFFENAKISTQNSCPTHWTTRGKLVKSGILQDWPTRKKRPKAVHPAPEHQISRHSTPKGSCPERRGFSLFPFMFIQFFQWRL